MNRYEVFMKVVEKGSFTKAAEELGYSQSAVSQMIQTLEDELSTMLISRSRKGVTLTPDGREFFPFITNIHHSYRELMEKSKEMLGLESGNIRIGTFSSVSCHWLPSLMKDFKQIYPSVHFQLQQGDYTSIVQYIKEGSVDFGFVNPKAAGGLQTVPLKEDEMLAVLPVHHSLADHRIVTLEDISKEPFILLEEGELSEPLEIFKENDLHPNIQYRVHDDYTIMSMVENDLGISILPQLILNKVSYRLVTKEITPPIVRTIGIAYKNKKTLPIASRYFIDFMIDKFGQTP
ncbi:LysR family transcriptional regulator [Bacillus aquiflavi]|uniref:LysR family transcriptional regulator n=1 Tax=Bacillus aquiflavi TaxID=2672567 RepID=A0A6B3W1E9_9BACI|nr:LysR family transcriptional regulator [Bacillus aquiflavi]MBA4538165.1 LysR family transcriptional regulator [Bacillus aquiflavi]NEY82485.1 LysR family transcriptional regulator [Bacillus aquiflavi]